MMKKNKQPGRPISKRDQRKIKQRERRIRINQRLEKERLVNEENSGIVNQLYKTIQHFFLDLFIWIQEIEDFRRKSEYELAELITACIAMFLFKSSSRNAFNNQRQEAKFKKNYEKLFHPKLPHPDTVNNVMRRLPEEALEQLKNEMLSALLEKKALHKYRYLGKWFAVAVDGTGDESYDHKHCEQCLHSTSKNGKTTYFHNVLEAKLVTENGFSISLATEWIENPTAEYDKQDCERRGFARLAKKIEKTYPRLPICLLVDGLYPYRGFFETCFANNWAFIGTFKDGCLPSVWQKIAELLPLMPDNRRQETIYQGKTKIVQNYRWVNDIDYRGFRIHWIECLEKRESEDGKLTETRISQVTNIRPCHSIIIGLLATGRMRWKIENKGFNQQKNGGYEMQHKYARKSYLALKNYYQCLQISHMISQLLILSSQFQARLKGKLTVKHLWICLNGELIWCEIDAIALANLAAQRIQIRFAA